MSACELANVRSIAVALIVGMPLAASSMNAKANRTVDAANSRASAAVAVDQMRSVNVRAMVRA